MTDRVNEIVSMIADDDEMVRVLCALERRFAVRISAVTRGDVEDEFQQSLLADELEPRQMTDDEWARFADEWFWRKGHSEVMFGGVPEAIRWDLRDAGIVPTETVI